MMTGFALVHVEPHHFKAFRAKIEGLRQVNVAAVGRIADVKTIHRLYTGHGDYEEFHVIVWVQADDVAGLREIFGTLEDAGCHIDGYGG